jgi:pimeloyl-ACP methyl ester carboxylesterase
MRRPLRFAAAFAFLCAFCAAAQERVAARSKDGVPLSVLKTGSGPALLLVHGSAAAGSSTWQAVLPALSRRFTVYVMDRRGRGLSGDGKSYSVAAEADDIAAVAAKIGEPLTLVAHSYGALCAVAAMDRLKGVTRLILYEPPILPQAPGPEFAGVLQALDRALQNNDRDLVATIFLRDAVGVPPAALEQMRSSPGWQGTVETAPTLPREARAVGAFRMPVERMRNWKAPTTMLAGDRTGGYLEAAAPAVCGAIPGCRLVTLEGQGHVAMLTAPDLFVSKVVEAAGARGP